MSEWLEYRLADVGSLARGKSKHRPRYAFHLYGGPYPFIQTGEVKKANKYITSFENTYSDEGLRQSKLWKAGTICITIAANIAEVAILKFDACFPDSVLGFIPDTRKTTTDFVYYTLKYFQRELKHLGEGSVQDNINMGTFDDFLFPFPRLPQQEAIAEVLSSLDDKIDLLHRNNKTLEQLAETLFRQWFVEEGEKNLYKKQLSDLISVVDNRGRTPSFTDTPTDYPIIEVNALTGWERYVKYSEIRKYVDEQTYKNWFRAGHPEINDILLTTVGSIGEMGMFLINKGTIAQNVVAFRAKTISPYYLYQYLKYIQDEIKEFDIGSVQPSIKVSQLILIEVPIPESAILTKFDSQLKEICDKITSNYLQIDQLETLRDTLLPKLMSGAVRVAN